jgi:hypothetical protein
MAHLIEPIENQLLIDAIYQLEKTQDLIVNSAISAQGKIGSEEKTWGSDFKRLEVQLPEGKYLIGKPTEKFVEVINILATTERTVSALKWFELQYPNAWVRECHASTSDYKGGNDIVLENHDSGAVIVRCEVTDITSKTASHNAKEKKDLKLLDCSEFVPNDGVDRYIATSLEYSTALISKKRRWKSLHYKYDKFETQYTNQTVLLKIVKP